MARVATWMAVADTWREGPPPVALPSQSGTEGAGCGTVRTSFQDWMLANR